MSFNVQDFSPEALDILNLYPWPGNIRELRNVVERTLVLHGKESRILPEHLPESIYKSPVMAKPVVSPVAPLGEAVAACERDLILKALKECNGIQTKTAQMLGITRRILGYKMKKMNIRCNIHSRKGEVTR